MWDFGVWEWLTQPNRKRAAGVELRDYRLLPDLILV